MKTIPLPRSVLIVACALIGCASQNPKIESEIDPQFKDYWYNGEAEISSFQLKQARYGELREGSASMIFVTEQFSKKNWSKPNSPLEKDPRVLKLNFTKKFITGIYPYSMMTSSFFPIDGPHSLKVGSSSRIILLWTGMATSWWPTCSTTGCKFFMFHNRVRRV